MGKSGEFFTFDQVLKVLAIDETKLKRLVSEGEIRAFREGDEMKFRKMDVENLDLVGAQSEERTGVIDLSAGREDTSETLTDDLIFDEGEDLDLSADVEAGMATAEISSQDTLVDEDGIGMSTEPLGVEPDEDMTEIVDAEDARGAVAVGARRPARARVETDEPKDLAWAALMFVTFIFMCLGLVVSLGIRDTNHSVAGDFAKSLSDTFGSEVR